MVAIAGIHVDDFLIGGREGNDTYEKGKKALEESYRWAWGKWEEKKFTFAGCDISQQEDYTITIDQNEYTKK